MIDTRAAWDRNERWYSPGPLVILGGYQTDFARNLTREGLDLSDLVAEVVAGTLADAGITAAEVGVIHVGNAFGQLFTGQGHLGAMPATVEPDLVGVPASRHEAACASGGIALLAAMADLEAGRYDCALVLGVVGAKRVGCCGGADHGGGSLGGPRGRARSLHVALGVQRRRRRISAAVHIDDAHLRGHGELNLRD